jgi:hypothetical protein
MDWASFFLGVLVAFCLILGLPWLLVSVYEAYERIVRKLKGGERVMVEKIGERSNYRVEDEQGKLLKEKFKDLHDAHEWAVNQILAGRTKAVIKAEIVIEKVK